MFVSRAAIVLSPLLAALICGASWAATPAIFSYYFGQAGSWETIPDEFEPRYHEGYSVGYPVGYTLGFGEGKVRGSREGWSAGEAAGHSAGWNEAYPLAFDLAYDEVFPVGHRDGWDVGRADGFQEGFEWAPVLAQEILNRWNGGGSSAGSLSISNINTYSGNFGLIDDSGILVWKSTSDNDWSALAYNEGYKTGHADGSAAGSQDGYDETYPVVFEKAFPIGHQLGIWDGSSDGKRDGSSQGYDDGLDVGYDLGWDEGFYAGIDYRLFGEYVQPQYSLQYTRRSDPLAARTLLAMKAPEPGGIVLALIAGAAGLGARFRSTFVGAAC